MLDRVLCRLLPRFVWLWTGVSLLVVGLGWATLNAQVDSTQEPVLSVARLDGQTTKVPLSAFVESGFQTADGTLVSWDEIDELKTDQRLLGDDPSTIVVHLRGGGTLQVRSLTAANGLVTLTTDLAELKYPLLDIKSVRFPKPEGETEWQALLAEQSAEADRLLVTTSRGPRTVSGLLEGMDEAGVKIVFEDQERSVTWDKILGILPAELDKSDDPKFILQTVDRSILIADSVSTSEGLWSIGWKGEKVSLPNDMLVSLRVRSNRILYLSDLNPVVDEVTTIIAPPANQRRNTNIFGQPISLRFPAANHGNERSSSQSKDNAASMTNRTFTRGWGTRSRGRLVFDLPEGYARFRGWVGIDSSANGQGICVAVVLVDGIQVFSQELTGKQSAVELDVPIDGGRRMELLVEPGAQLDLSDWVNWADVRLQK